MTMRHMMIYRLVGTLLAVCLTAFVFTEKAVAGGLQETSGSGSGSGGGACRDTMNVVMLGDSNTWLGGDSCTAPRGWTRWFAEAFAPASCHSYARSGATWTNTVRTVRDVSEYTELLGDNNVIYNQICRLCDAVADGRQPVPHIIIISAGTNDAWFSKARPGALGLSADGVPDVEVADAYVRRAPCRVLTLAEAVMEGCAMLRGAFPEARIVLLTPLQTTATSLSSIRRAGDIIEGCGRRLGLTVIRQDRDGCVRRADEQRRRRMTTDGTHTSEEGAGRNGRMIALRLTDLWGGGR